MTTPVATYLKHRAAITQVLRQIGIRETARQTGLTANAVTRYCSHQGSDDARTHYVLAEFARVAQRASHGRYVPK